jgi:nitroreductase
MVELTTDELLSTTRAVRYRLDLDRPVARGLIEASLKLAVQAPSGSNSEPWHWIVVSDAGLRAELAALYRRSFRSAAASPHFASRLFSDDPERSAVQQQVADSATYLAEQLHHVPVLVIPCIAGRPPPTAAEQSGFWGSIIPAVWSFMLAARTRGLGTAFTTVHLHHEREAADILGIPYDTVTQVALVPVAHYTGTTFRPAVRRVLSEVTSWNGWEQ